MIFYGRFIKTVREDFFYKQSVTNVNFGIEFPSPILFLIYMDNTGKKSESFGG